MVNINIYGIDPYLLYQLSRDITSQLASIYEIEEKDITFFAPEGLLVHSGADQNNYNINVIVNAPRKVQVLQKEATKILVAYLSKVVVNIDIIYSYYLMEERETHIVNNYPLFICEKNSVDIEENENENFENLYDGDIFASIKDKLGE